VSFRAERRTIALELPITPKWTPDFVEADIDLRHFRGDNAYVAQYRDRNVDGDFCLTAYYLKSIDRLGLFERLDEDELFGVCAISFNGDHREHHRAQLRGRGKVFRRSTAGARHHLPPLFDFVLILAQGTILRLVGAAGRLGLS
jgi:hypothetical protein